MILKTLQSFLFLAVLCISASAQAAFTTVDVEGKAAAKGSTKETRAYRRMQRDVVIVLDPGHGGEDFGASSKTKPKTHEKFLTLSTSVMLSDNLKKMGYNVILSRTNDKFIELQERADFAGRKEATIFVSVHYNTAPSIEAQGIEVYYYDSKDSGIRTKQSKKLAQTVLTNVIEQTKAKSRGIKHGNFAVIRETKMPAILIEGGFISNTEELANLKNPSYLGRIAKGIAAGIDGYLKKTMLTQKSKALKT